jgi:hypothetical protein
LLSAGETTAYLVIGNKTQPCIYPILRAELVGGRGEKEETDGGTQKFEFVVIVSWRDGCLVVYGVVLGVGVLGD